MGRSDKKEIKRLERDLEKQKRKNNMEHTIFLVIMSCIYVAAGAFLTFMQQTEIIYLCYMLCAGLMIYGIILIVRYFLKELYKKLHDYSFSAGVLLVILGSCALARAGEVAENITLYLGLCILITSIVMLQNAIQLKTLGSSLWSAMLAISCAAIVCAVLIIANMQFMAAVMMTFTCWVLMIGGIISAASLMLVYFSIQKYNRQGAQSAAEADMPFKEKTDGQWDQEAEEDTETGEVMDAESERTEDSEGLPDPAEKPKVVIEIENAMGGKNN